MSSIENISELFIPGTLWRSFYHREIGLEKGKLGDWGWLKKEETIVVSPRLCFFVLQVPKKLLSKKKNNSHCIITTKVLSTTGQLGWFSTYQGSQLAENPEFFLEEIK